MATDNPKEPYGDVMYADPGYQDDGQKRYPCDTEEHARAAWAYVSVPKNAAKYTPEQLAEIKSRIRAALKKYGVEVAAELEAPVTAGASSYQEKGAGRMDPAKIREGLGLAADAPDEDVKAALVEAGYIEKAEAPPLFEVAASAPKAPAAKPGTMTIDQSAWTEAQERLKKLEAQAAQQRADERDQVIAQAVRDGKFAPVRRDHWARLWDADPEGTREVIAGLARGVIPVAASGYDGDASDDDFDREFAHLFGKAGVTRG